MQKLQVKLKNVPTDAPQVCSSISGGLNREKTLSARGIVRACNNLEVDQPQSHTGGLKAVVYVLSVIGNPLMPCSMAKARKLIKGNSASVVKLYPFTIKLKFECENQVQPVILGIDSGYKNIGFSCVTEKRELISGTVILDGKTSERLAEKAMYRSSRRNRLWHRKPRFLNRKRKTGYLRPSVQRRYNTHLVIINRMKALMPISRVIVEIASFDIQKIENPNIEGVEYCHGDMYGYQNMRGYLMYRERGLCQLCKKPFTRGNTSHIHHCKQRSEAGSGRAKNLAILHEKCHVRLHEQGLRLKSPKSYKSSTFMSIIHNRFYRDVPGLSVTYGYITFLRRRESNIAKSHNNDAFVIAHGSIQERCIPITIRQKHRNNRAIQLNRRGYAPAVRRQRYSIQPKDIIWVGNKKLTALGVHCRGKSVLVSETRKSIPITKISRFYNFGGLAWAI